MKETTETVSNEKLSLENQPSNARYANSVFCTSSEYIAIFYTNLSYLIKVF